MKNLKIFDDAFLAFCWLLLIISIILFVIFGSFLFALFIQEIQWSS